MVLEEEEGLKKCEDHVHNRYEHVEWSVTLHPVLIFKHLGNSESIENHCPGAETYRRNCENVHKYVLWINRKDSFHIY